MLVHENTAVHHVHVSSRCIN